MSFLDSFLDSFTTNLMPRTSELPGMAAGVHISGARSARTGIDTAQALVLGTGRLRIEWDDDTPVPRSARFPEGRFAGGVPVDTSRTQGARWFG